MPAPAKASLRDARPSAAARPAKRTAIPVAASMRLARTAASPIPESGRVTPSAPSSRAGSAVRGSSSCRLSPSQGRRSTIRMVEKRGPGGALSASTRRAVSSVSVRASSHGACPQPANSIARSAAASEAAVRAPRPPAPQPCNRVPEWVENRPVGIAARPPALRRGRAGKPLELRLSTVIKQRYQRVRYTPEHTGAPRSKREYSRPAENIFCMPGPVPAPSALTRPPTRP